MLYKFLFPNVTFKEYPKKKNFTIQIQNSVQDREREMQRKESMACGLQLNTINYLP